MRKLKLQMQISLDGFNSTGPNDEQKWVTWAWGEIKDYVLELSSVRLKVEEPQLVTGLGIKLCE